MTKWPEQCRADTGVASWMAGRSRRPQEENTDNILSWEATARTSLRERKSRKNWFLLLCLFIQFSKLFEWWIYYITIVRVTPSIKRSCICFRYDLPAPCSSDHRAGQQRVPVSSVSGASQLAELRTRDHRHLVLHLQEHRRLHAYLHTVKTWKKQAYPNGLVIRSIIKNKISVRLVSLFLVWFIWADQNRWQHLNICEMKLVSAQFYLLDVKLRPKQTLNRKMKRQRREETFMNTYSCCCSSYWPPIEGGKEHYSVIKTYYITYSQCFRLWWFNFMKKGKLFKENYAKHHFSQLKRKKKKEITYLKESLWFKNN